MKETSQIDAAATAAATATNATATSTYAKTAVRHAEKRRTASCGFANRVAAACVQHYREVVPASFQRVQKQTCLAAVVAHETHLTDDNDNDNNDCLTIVGLGVGTKFLSEAALQTLHGDTDDDDDDDESYGDRVRDCHAEVLARRAFRRYLSIEMKRILQSTASSTNDDSAILERTTPPDSPSPLSPPSSARLKLKSNVTLHLYTSSSPCGNACLKKFATLQGDFFRTNLPDTAWITEPHATMPGHSQRQGQFALTLKRDATVLTSTSYTEYHDNHKSGNDVRVHKRSRIEATDTAAHPTTTASDRPTKPIGKKSPVTWAANRSDDWCVSGTTTVWSGRGSLHTCSDKICRWNCLGLQGSLLAARLQSPLYLSSVTVGRKLTPVTCRRALCCRMGSWNNCSNGTSSTHNDNGSTTPTSASSGGSYFTLHHPAIMGTSVYMDDDGVIDMSANAKATAAATGQDVRFHSTLSWVWWSGLVGVAECIDGATGWTVLPDTTGGEAEGDRCNVSHGDRGGDSNKKRSRVSTAALLELHLEIDPANSQPTAASAKIVPRTLSELRIFKKQTSPAYENAKEQLLTRHPVFRQWKRREKHG